jgi:hypothetical protein
MFCNSWGLAKAKSLELQQIIHVNKIDALGIVEAEAVTDDKHITTFRLPRIQHTEFAKIKEKGLVSHLLVAFSSLKMEKCLREEKFTVKKKDPIGIDVVWYIDFF